MKLFGRNHIVLMAITFAILFAMNYIGNNQPDKLERALLTAGCGILGLTIGLIIYNRGKNDNSPPQNFD